MTTDTDLLGTTTAILIETAEAETEAGTEMTGMENLEGMVAPLVVEMIEALLENMVGDHRIMTVHHRGATMVTEATGVEGTATVEEVVDAVE